MGRLPEGESKTEGNRPIRGFSRKMTQLIFFYIINEKVIRQRYFVCRFVYRSVYSFIGHNIVLRKYFTAQIFHSARYKIVTFGLLFS